ncbi:MAG: HlyC/CorC family transporter [Bacteroidales bacterium]|nr:HlyC/CorC family transporter [Bacteroidales bacterium]
MTPLSWLVVAAVSLLFSALFSGVEIAFITSERVMLGLDIKKGGLVGRAISRFYSDRDLFISTILVGNNVMLVIYGMAAARLIEPWLNNVLHGNEGLVLLCSTLISTLVILFVGEFFPKTTFRINPNSSLKFVALPMFLFYVVLYPVAWFTSWLSRMLMRLVGVRESQSGLGVLSVGELNSYLEERIDNVSNPEATEVETEVKMFHNALDFSKTQLRDCMLPRNEIVAVDIDNTSREQLSNLFTTSGRSKIIVYREDIDNVLGYIHVSELFVPDTDWTALIKPVLFAPETLLANKMMRRLLSEKRSMAVVVDEFGGTAGLVTLEDLVEEIFGDIRDEHDTQGLTANEVAPGVYEFSGRIEVRDLRDNYRLDIPEDDDYQTLAGYLLYNIGSLPEKGQTLVIGRYSFTILERTATRIELIRVEPAPEEVNADD